jgi:hypothetical protein
MICSSVNLDRFIVRPDFSCDWLSFRRSRHYDCHWANGSARWRCEACLHSLSVISGHSLPAFGRGKANGSQIAGIFLAQARSGGRLSHVPASW